MGQSKSTSVALGQDSEWDGVFSWVELGDSLRGRSECWGDNLFGRYVELEWINVVAVVA
jgi:hypothetical protein